MEELSIRGIFNNIWNKKIEIILIIVIFTIIGGVYTYNFTKPSYKSFTTLVLAKDTGDSTSTTSTSDSITGTDISLNNQLVSTYSALIKTQDVLEQVVKNLNINVNIEELKNSITVNSVTGTQLIKITVTNSDAKKAALISDETANVFIQKIAKDIYKINNIHVVEKAVEQTEPYNINHKKDLILFAMGGIAISAIYIFSLTLFDTTIKSTNDIELATNLTVLASIPECEKNKKGGKRK